MTDDSGDRNRRSTIADRSAHTPEAAGSGPSAHLDAADGQERKDVARPSFQLLKALDAAKALAISPRKLWGLTQSGEIKCVRIGRAVRYAPEDLAAFIAAKRDG